MHSVDDENPDDVPQNASIEQPADLVDESTSEKPVAETAVEPEPVADAKNQDGTTNTEEVDKW